MKLFIGLLSIALVCASVACSTLAQARAPAFILRDPTVLRFETSREGNVDLVINVWERDYEVPGATASEVADNLAALRRNGTGHGPYSASTQWDLKLGLRYANEPGGCRLASASVEVAAIITMPALQDGSALDPGMGARWDAFLSALREHELSHIENEVTGGRDFQAALNELGVMETCRAVGDAANVLLESQKQQINQADATLDAETEHGARTGATFP